MIQNVSLRANRIGAVGAAALGKALEDEDCTLERLDLGDNELHDEGAVLIAQEASRRRRRWRRRRRRWRRCSRSARRWRRRPRRRRTERATDATNADAPRPDQDATEATRGGGEGGGGAVAVGGGAGGRRQGADAAVHREAAGGAGGGGGGGGALARAAAGGADGGRRLPPQQVADEPAAVEQWDTHRALPALVAAIAKQDLLSELDLSVNPFDPDDDDEEEAAAARHHQGRRRRLRRERRRGRRRWWQWPRVMTTFGEKLGGGDAMSKFRLQYNRGVPKAGACVGAALAGGCLTDLNLQGPRRRRPRVRARPRGECSPARVNRGPHRRRPAALPGFLELLRDNVVAIESLNLGYNRLEGPATGGRAAPPLRRTRRGVAGNASPRSSTSAEPVQGAGVATVVGALPGPAPLEVLNLSFCALRADGAEALAAYLARTNCTLTSLRVDGCELGPDGAAAIAGAIEAKKLGVGLKTLRLECNAIGEGGAAALGRALAGNTDMRALYLGCNELGQSEACAQSLAEGLSMNAMLRTLDLGDNLIREAGVRAVRGRPRAADADGARPPSCAIGDGGAEAVARELEANGAPASRASPRTRSAPTASARSPTRRRAPCETLLLDVTQNPRVAYPTS